MFGPLFAFESRALGRWAWPFVARTAATAGLLYLLYHAVTTIVPETMPLAKVPYHRELFAARFSMPLFQWAYLLCLLLTPGVFATPIARARESRLLELLQTTQIQPSEIVWGLWGARVALFAMLLLSVVPVLALATTYGGVSYGPTLTALATLAAAGFAISGAALLGSLFGANTREGVAAGYAVPVVLFLTLTSLSFAVREAARIRFLPEWLRDGLYGIDFLWSAVLSPAGAIDRFVHPGLSFGALRPYWLAGFVGFHLFIGWAALRAATVILAKRLDARVGERRAVARRAGRDFGRWPIFAHEWRHGPSSFWLRVQAFLLLAGGGLALATPTISPIFRPWPRLWHMLGDWSVVEEIGFYAHVGGGLFVLALLQIAFRAVHSWDAERQRDTRQTLLSACWTTREIVWQKTLAATRPAFDLLLLWTGLLALTTVRQLATPWAAVVYFVVPSWAFLMAALGFLAALAIRNAGRAAACALVGFGIFWMAIYGWVQLTLGKPTPSRHVAARQDSLPQWILGDAFWVGLQGDFSYPPLLLAVPLAAAALGAGWLATHFATSVFERFAERYETRQDRRLASTSAASASASASRIGSFVEPPAE